MSLPETASVILQGSGDAEHVEELVVGVDIFFRYVNVVEGSLERCAFAEGVLDARVGGDVGKDGEVAVDTLFVIETSEFVAVRKLLLLR